MNPILIIIESMILALWVSCSAIGGGGSSTYEDLLALVPDTPETRKGVHINDFAKIKNEYDVITPGPGFSSTEFDQYVRDLTIAFFTNSDGHQDGSFIAAPTPWISGIDLKYMSGPYENKQNIGFDATDMAQTVIAGGLTHRRGYLENPVEIGIGNINPTFTQQRLEACSQCPETTISEYKGTSYYTWEDGDSVNILRRFSPPLFDELGKIGQVMVEDGRAYRTLSTETMKILIDTRNGEYPSLADDKNYSLLAKAMADMGVFSATFSDQTPSMDTHEHIEIIWELMVSYGEVDTNIPLLRPYDAYAVGSGRDENGEYVAVALVHSNEESALENVEILRRRLQELNLPDKNYLPILIGFDDSNFLEIWELKTEGSVLTAKATDTQVAIRWRLFSGLPPFGIFFAHE